MKRILWSCLIAGCALAHNIVDYGAVNGTVDALNITVRNSQAMLDAIIAAN